MKTLRPLNRPRPTGAGGNTSSALRAPVGRRVETVTTATLQRGRVYFFHNVPFERNTEIAIDQSLITKYNVPYSPEGFAAEIEDLYEDVVDSDGDDFAKPIFEVRHNRPRPLSIDEQKRAARPRRIRQFVEVASRANEPPAVRSIGRPRTVNAVRR